MPTNDNAGALREWLRGCPAIARDRLFGADYLAEDEGYSLDALPTALKYRENILGDVTPRETQEQDFAFACRERYGADVRQNLDNLGMLRDVADWILAQNGARRFPAWAGGEVAAIVPVEVAGPTQMGGASARYQILIRVTYRVSDS